MAIDTRSAAIGGRGVEIGTVELDGTGTPSAAWVVIIPLDGASAISRAEVSDVFITGAGATAIAPDAAFSTATVDDAVLTTEGSLDGDAAVSTATVADAVLTTTGAAALDGAAAVSTATVDDTVLVGGVQLLNGDAAFSTATVDDAVLSVDVPWTPSEITTAGWWDASDSTTLFDAATGGSAVSADGAIARWEDKSGNARHWKQSTLGDRPLRKAAQVNSLDTVLFDGTSDGMLLDADLSFTSHTIFVMFRPSATITDASASEAFLTGGTFGSGTAETLLLTGSVTGNLSGERLSHLIVQDSPVAQVYGYAKTNADVSGVNQFALQWNDSTTTFAGYLNGNTDFAATSSAGGFSSGRKPTDIRYLGYRGLNNTAHLGADICEVVILSSAATTDTRQRVEGYLAHRWGTTASLPSGHPYKTNPPLV